MLQEAAPGKAPRQSWSGRSRRTPGRACRGAPAPGRSRRPPRPAAPHPSSERVVGGSHCGPIRLVLQVGVVQLHLGGGRPPLASPLEREAGCICRLLPVVHALEVLARSRWASSRGRCSMPSSFSISSSSSKGSLGLPVHLVDKGEDGDVPHDAHLKQLAGLGLHALGRRR